MSVQTISPSQLGDLVKSGRSIHVIDVRTPLEFREIHATCAKNFPLEKLDPNEIAKTRNGSSEVLYVICKSGARGKQACEKLIAAGQSNVVNVDGGTAAWEQAGLPVVRGQKAMSLERQVRIAAGSIVFAGVLLSYFVHPYFIWLSGFIGAGLVFAGVTDTCGMGMVIAKMPWNQVRG
ncbi:MAG: rhodanese-like domain-containing protein [Planctomycetota bacterium]|nr:rhodanese-like domain-containing protein [Planctomycetota bacterium]